MANTTGKKHGGRQKGTTNKDTKAIRDMIIQALDEVGGVDYLVQQAKDSPTAFMSLIAKVLPTQLTGDNHGAIQLEAKTTPEQLEALRQWALLKHGTNPVTV